MQIICLTTKYTYCMKINVWGRANAMPFAGYMCSLPLLCYMWPTPLNDSNPLGSEGIVVCDSLLGLSALICMLLRVFFLQSFCFQLNTNTNVLTLKYQVWSHLFSLFSHTCTHIHTHLSICTSYTPLPSRRWLMNKLTYIIYSLSFLSWFSQHEAIFLYFELSSFFVQSSMTRSFWFYFELNFVPPLR